VNNSEQYFESKYGKGFVMAMYEEYAKEKVRETIQIILQEILCTFGDLSHLVKDEKLIEYLQSKQPEIKEE